MLYYRDLMEVKEGLHPLMPMTHGVLGSTIPTTGDNGQAALAYNDVVSNGLLNNGVEVRVTSHNFPAGFFVWSDTSWIAPNLVGGITYTANGYLVVDGVDIGATPYPLLTLSVGAVTPTQLTVAASLAMAVTPTMAGEAVIGQTFTAAATLVITGAVPSISALASVGYALPAVISPSRTTVVDLDSDATHPAAVFIKDPQAVLDYGIDVTDWLADSQDSLQQFTAAPTTDSDVSVHAYGLLGGIMAVMVGGGTPGLPNAVLFDFSTVGGRQDQRTIYFQIQER